MLDIILLIIGIGGFGLASYFDLRYTEFPDWLPYGMVAAILIVRVLFGFYLGDFSGFLNSVLIGIGFLAFGFILYFLKQWGNGDAWLLGVLGFILPNSLMGFKTIVPYYLNLVLNFFLVAFVYLVAYSITIGFKSADVRKLFFRRIKGEARIPILMSLVFLGVYLVFFFSFLQSIALLSKSFYMYIGFPFLIVFVVFFLQYAKAVETKLFRRKVNVRELKAGDVIVGKRWKGLTEQELKKFKKRGGQVWIKEGVRFAPVYLITLLVSVLVGGLLI